MDYEREVRSKGIRTDETVRFRHHQDGSLSILSMDGRIVHCHISAERLSRLTEAREDEAPFYKAVIIAALISLPFWFAAVAYLISVCR